MYSGEDILHLLKGAVNACKNGAEEDIILYLDHFTKHQQKAIALFDSVRTHWRARTLMPNVSYAEALHVLLRIEPIWHRTVLECIDCIHNGIISGRIVLYCISEIQVALHRLTEITTNLSLVVMANGKRSDSNDEDIMVTSGLEEIAESLSSAIDQVQEIGEAVINPLFDSVTESTANSNGISNAKLWLADSTGGDVLQPWAKLQQNHQQQQQQFAIVLELLPNIVAALHQFKRQYVITNASIQQREQQKDDTELQGAVDLDVAATTAMLDDGYIDLLDSMFFVQWSATLTLPIASILCELYSYMNLKHLHEFQVRLLNATHIFQTQSDDFAGLIRVAFRLFEFSLDPRWAEVLRALYAAVPAVTLPDTEVLLESIFSPNVSTCYALLRVYEYSFTQQIQEWLLSMRSTTTSTTIGGGGGGDGGGGFAGEGGASSGSSTDVSLILVITRAIHSASLQATPLLLPPPSPPTTTNTNNAYASTASSSSSSSSTTAASLLGLFDSQQEAAGAASIAFGGDALATSLSTNDIPLPIRLLQACHHNGSGGSKTNNNNSSSAIQIIVEAQLCARAFLMSVLAASIRFLLLQSTNRIPSKCERTATTDRGTAAASAETHRVNIGAIQSISSQKLLLSIIDMALRRSLKLPGHGKQDDNDDNDNTEDRGGEDQCLDPNYCYSNWVSAVRAQEMVRLFFILSIFPALVEQCLFSLNNSTTISSSTSGIGRSDSSSSHHCAHDGTNDQRWDAVKEEKQEQVKIKEERQGVASINETSESQRCNNSNSMSGDDDRGCDGEEETINTCSHQQQEDNEQKGREAMRENVYVDSDSERRRNHLGLLVVECPSATEVINTGLLAVFSTVPDTRSALVCALLRGIACLVPSSSAPASASSSSSSASALAHQRNSNVSSSRLPSELFLAQLLSALNALTFKFAKIVVEQVNYSLLERHYLSIKSVVFAFENAHAMPGAGGASKGIKKLPLTSSSHGENMKRQKQQQAQQLGRTKGQLRRIASVSTYLMRLCPHSPRVFAMLLGHARKAVQCTQPMLKQYAITLLCRLLLLLFPGSGAPSTSFIGGESAALEVVQSMEYVLQLPARLRSHAYRTLLRLSSLSSRSMSMKSEMCSSILTQPAAIHHDPDSGLNGENDGCVNTRLSAPSPPRAPPPLPHIRNDGREEGAPGLMNLPIRALLQLRNLVLTRLRKCFAAAAAAAAAGGGGGASQLLSPRSNRQHPRARFHEYDEEANEEGEKDANVCFCPGLAILYPSASTSSSTGNTSGLGSTSTTSRRSNNDNDVPDTNNDNDNNIAVGSSPSGNCYWREDVEHLIPLLWTLDIAVLCRSCPNNDSDMRSSTSRTSGDVAGDDPRDLNSQDDCNGHIAAQYESHMAARIAQAVLSTKSRHPNTYDEDNDDDNDDDDDDDDGTVSVNLLKRIICYVQSGCSSSSASPAPTSHSSSSASTAGSASAMMMELLFTYMAVRAIQLCLLNAAANIPMVNHNNTTNNKNNNHRDTSTTRSTPVSLLAAADALATTMDLLLELMAQLTEQEISSHQECLLYYRTHLHGTQNLLDDDASLTNSITAANLHSGSSNCIVSVMTLVDQYVGVTATKCAYNNAGTSSQKKLRHTPANVQCAPLSVQLGSLTQLAHLLASLLPTHHGLTDTDFRNAGAQHLADDDALVDWNDTAVDSARQRASPHAHSFSFFLADLVLPSLLRLYRHACTLAQEVAWMEQEIQECKRYERQQSRSSRSRSSRSSQSRRARRNSSRYNSGGSGGGGRRDRDYDHDEEEDFSAAIYSDSNSDSDVDIDEDEEVEEVEEEQEQGHMSHRGWAAGGAGVFPGFRISSVIPAASSSSIAAAGASTAVPPIDMTMRVHPPPPLPASSPPPPGAGNTEGGDDITIHLLGGHSYSESSSYAHTGHGNKNADHTGDRNAVARNGDDTRMVNKSRSVLPPLAHQLLVHLPVDLQSLVHRWDVRIISQQHQQQKQKQRSQRNQANQQKWTRSTVQIALQRSLFNLRCEVLQAIRHVVAISPFEKCSIEVMPMMKTMAAVAPAATSLNLHVTDKSNHLAECPQKASAGVNMNPSINPTGEAISVMKTPTSSTKNTVVENLGSFDEFQSMSHWFACELLQATQSGIMIRTFNAYTHLLRALLLRQHQQQQWWLWCPHSGSKYKDTHRSSSIGAFHDGASSLRSHLDVVAVAETATAEAAVNRNSSSSTSACTAGRALWATLKYIHSPHAYIVRNIVQLALQYCGLETGLESCCMLLQAVGQKIFHSEKESTPLNSVHSQEGPSGQDDDLNKHHNDESASEYQNKTTRMGSSVSLSHSSSSSSLSPSLLLVTSSVADLVAKEVLAHLESTLKLLLQVPTSTYPAADPLANEAAANRAIAHLLQSLQTHSNESHTIDTSNTNTSSATSSATSSGGGHDTLNPALCQASATLLKAVYNPFQAYTTATISSHKKTTSSTRSTSNSTRRSNNKTKNQNSNDSSNSRSKTTHESIRSTGVDDYRHSRSSRKRSRPNYEEDDHDDDDDWEEEMEVEEEEEEEEEEEVDWNEALPLQLDNFSDARAVKVLDIVIRILTQCSKECNVVLKAAQHLRKVTKFAVQVTMATASDALHHRISKSHTNSRGNKNMEYDSDDWSAEDCSEGEGSEEEEEEDSCGNSCIDSRDGSYSSSSGSSSRYQRKLQRQQQEDSIHLAIDKLLDAVVTPSCYLLFALLAAVPATFIANLKLFLIQKLFISSSGKKGQEKSHKKNATTATSAATTGKSLTATQSAIFKRAQNALLKLEALELALFTILQELDKPYPQLPTTAGQLAGEEEECDGEEEEEEEEEHDDDDDDDVDDDDDEENNEKEEEDIDGDNMIYPRHNDPKYQHNQHYHSGNATPTSSKSKRDTSGIAGRLQQLQHAAHGPALSALLLLVDTQGRSLLQILRGEASVESESHPTAESSMTTSAPGGSGNTNKQHHKEEIEGRDTCVVSAVDEMIESQRTSVLEIAREAVTLKSLSSGRAVLGAAHAPDVSAFEAQSSRDQRHHYHQNSEQHEKSQQEQQVKWLELQQTRLRNYYQRDSNALDGNDGTAGTTTTTTAAGMTSRAVSTAALSSRAASSSMSYSQTHKRTRLRSRNRVIDAWLDAEDGTDAYADLEGFLVE